jgi:hypothetical protein
MNGEQLMEYLDSHFGGFCGASDNMDFTPGAETYQLTSDQFEELRKYINGILEDSAVARRQVSEIKRMLGGDALLAKMLRDKEHEVAVLRDLAGYDVDEPWF